MVSEYETLCLVLGIVETICRLLHDASDIFDSLPQPLADISQDFQQHFREIQRQHSPVQRPFYHHLTSVVVSYPVQSPRLHFLDYVFRIPALLQQPLVSVRSLNRD